MRALRMRLVTLSASMTQTTAPQPEKASRSTACVVRQRKGSVSLRTAYVEHRLADDFKELRSMLAPDEQDRTTRLFWIHVGLPERLAEPHELLCRCARGFEVLRLR
jgi:hypothetical protein